MEPEYEQAPVYPVGERRFLCVEYPGIVKNIDRVLETLGGEKAVSQAYANKDNQPLELRYRPKDPFCHCINGSMVPSSRVVVKVTRRRRKDQPEDQGQLTTEVIGTIPHTCRFRGLADFQYLVPESDSARKLRTAIVTGDAKSIQQLRIPLDKPDKNHLHAIPPPIFSTSETPFRYEYKQNSPVVRVRVQQPDGTYVTKLINRSTRKTPPRVLLHFEANQIPTGPPTLYPLTGKALVVKEQIIKLFNERPIWSKFALRHCLDDDDDVPLSMVLPCVAYSFRNGPWRDCWVKYGIDPRTDQRFAFYQQVDIRVGHPEEKPVNAYVRAKRSHTLPIFLPDYQQSNNDDSSSIKQSGTGRFFDGQKLPSRSAWYQVCDITDPDFDCILRTTKYQHSTPPTKYSGYFYTSALVAVRAAMRQKIKQLNENGHCDRILDMDEGLDQKIERDKEKIAKSAMERTGAIRGSTFRDANLESDNEDDDYNYNEDDDDNDGFADAVDGDGTEMMDTDDWN